MNFLRRLLKPDPRAVTEGDGAWRRAVSSRPHASSLYTAELDVLADGVDLRVPGAMQAGGEPVARLGAPAPASGPTGAAVSEPAPGASAGATVRVGPGVTSGAQPAATRFSREIWAVGGGKGGIGKSLITSNLGISLARAGRRVVLVDADLGGANLHTCLGIPEPKVTLTDFVSRRVRGIEDILIRTGVPNLSLISGAHDFLSAANLNFVQKTMLLRRIADLDADVVILDLGAGTTYNTLDFFLLAQKGIVIAVPEPTSIENCYRFIKSAFYRRLRRVVANAAVKRLIETAMDQKNTLGIRTPNDLLDRIAQMDPGVGEVIRREVGQFRPRIIMNQARTRADVEIGEHMRSACRKYFGIQVEYLGAIDYDDVVWQSIRRREPLLVKHPGSVSARSVERIAARLLQGA